MTRVFIITTLGLLILEFAAAGQDLVPECAEALNTLDANTARCTATAENPRAMCSGPCGTYYETILDSCPSEVIASYLAIA